MQFVRKLGVLLAVGTTVVAAACAPVGADTSRSVVNQDSLVVGVSANVPGIGTMLQEGHYAGFDVDVALYIAKELGYEPENVSFVTASDKNGEELVESGKADMVLATYSITPKRATRLQFAGPYYLAHMDLAVSSDDDEISTVRDLSGKRLCTPPNSLGRTRIGKTLGIETVKVTERNDYQCLAAVRAGSADAMAADGLVLAGLMQYSSGGVKILNAPFTDERWGVAMHEDDVRGCEAVNRAIAAMYTDGSAQDFLERWFGSSNLELHAQVPQFEGCG